MDTGLDQFVESFAQARRDKRQLCKYAVDAISCVRVSRRTLQIARYRQMSWIVYGGCQLCDPHNPL